MTTTAFIGLLLGLVVAPTMGARAWVADPQKAAVFGFLAAGSLVVGCLLVALALRMELRWPRSVWK